MTYIMGKERRGKGLSATSDREISTCFANYIRQGNRKRLIWLLLLLLCIIMLCYNLLEIAIAYNSKSIILSVKTKVLDKIKFPALTFCKGTVLPISSVPNEQLVPLDSSTMTESIHRSSIFLRTLLANNYIMPFGTLQDFTAATTNHDEFLLTSLAISCVFGIYSHCRYPIDIVKSITSSYGGTCFQFNGKGNFYQREVSAFYGLSMILFVNQSDNIPLSSMDFGGGIVLNLHEPGEHGFPEYNGILVSPGFLTRLSLKKVTYKRLKAPYPSNCTYGENIDLYYPGRYTTFNCKRSCMVRDSIEQCGTTDPLTMMLLNKTGKYKIKRFNKTALGCLGEAEEKSISSDSNNCDCPIPCQEVSYIPTISQTKWPSQADLPYYKQAFARALSINMSKLTDEYVYHNFLHLNIYFDQLSYEEVLEMEEWTIQKLISDLGGQLGIWIGASLLSLYEFVDSLSTLVSEQIKKRKSRSVNTMQ